jgi:hypothetical protein
MAQCGQISMPAVPRCNVRKIPPQLGHCSVTADELMIQFLASDKFGEFARECIWFSTAGGASIFF